MIVLVEETPPRILATLGAASGQGQIVGMRVLVGAERFHSRLLSICPTAPCHGAFGALVSNSLMISDVTSSESDACSTELCGALMSMIREYPASAAY